MDSIILQQLWKMPSGACEVQLELQNYKVPGHSKTLLRLSKLSLLKYILTYKKEAGEYTYIDSRVGVVDQHVQLTILLPRHSLKQLFYITLFRMVTLDWDTSPSSCLHLISHREL